MNEEVKAAMERLLDCDLAHYQGPTGDDANMRAAIMLARYVRAEHPADDEAGITEGWLREVGGKDKTYQGDTVLAFRAQPGPIGDTQWIELADETNGMFYFCRWSPMYDEGTPPDRVELLAGTRGAFRRLCQCLGIPLNEKARTE